MALRNKQKVFIIEYLKDFNATQAAIRAGYSVKTAYSIGQENLKKPELAEAIKAEIAERSMGPDEVLTRLADIARGDVADLMALSSSGYEFELLIDDGHGNKIPNPKTKLIKKIRQKVTTILSKNDGGDDREIIETELELYPADSALMDIAKLSGMLVDRSENLNIDLSTLTDEQLDRIARGEKITNVLKRPTT